MRPTLAAYARGVPDGAEPRDGRPVLRVRAGREADAAEVARFVPAGLDWAVTVSAMGALVATEDGVVQGVLVRWPHPAHVLVERLAVAPHARRGGVGSLLLDAAEREALESGVNRVRSPAGRAHDPFLRRHGYAPVADGSALEKRLLP